MSSVIKEIGRVFKKPKKLLFPVQAAGDAFLGAAKDALSPVLPDAPKMPTYGSAETSQAGDAARVAAMRRSRGGTLLTGGAGLEDEDVVKKKTLLGG